MQMNLVWGNSGTTSCSGESPVYLLEDYWLAAPSLSFYWDCQEIRARFWHPVIIIVLSQDFPFSVWFPFSLVALAYRIFTQSLLSGRHWEYMVSMKRPAFLPLSAYSPCVCVINCLRILFGNKDVNHNYGFLGPAGFLTTSLFKKSSSVYFYSTSLCFHFLCLFFPSNFF